MTSSTLRSTDSAARVDVAQRINIEDTSVLFVAKDIVEAEHVGLHIPRRIT